MDRRGGREGRRGLAGRGSLARVRRQGRLRPRRVRRVRHRQVFVQAGESEDMESAGTEPPLAERRSAQGRGGVRLGGGALRHSRNQDDAGGRLRPERQALREEARRRQPPPGLGVDRKRRAELSALARRQEVQGLRHGCVQVRPLSAGPRVHGRLRRAGDVRHRRDARLAVLEQQGPALRAPRLRRHKEHGEARQVASVAPFLGTDPERDALSVQVHRECGKDGKGELERRQRALRVRFRFARKPELRHRIRVRAEEGARRVPPRMGRLRGRLVRAELDFACEARMGRGADGGAGPALHEGARRGRFAGSGTSRRMPLARHGPRARLPSGQLLRRHTHLRQTQKVFVARIQGGADERAVCLRRERIHALFGQPCRGLFELHVRSDALREPLQAGRDAFRLRVSARPCPLGICQAQGADGTPGRVHRDAARRLEIREAHGKARHADTRVA